MCFTEISFQDIKWFKGVNYYATVLPFHIVKWSGKMPTQENCITVISADTSWGQETSRRQKKISIKVDWLYFVNLVCVKHCIQLLFSQRNSLLFWRTVYISQHEPNGQSHCSTDNTASCHGILQSPSKNNWSWREIYYLNTLCTIEYLSFQ